MNCLKYHKNAKPKHFYDKIFEKDAIPIINRPIRISEHSANLIDNILTTDIFNNSLKKRCNYIRCFWSFSNIFLNTADEGKASGRCYKNKKKRVFNNRNMVLSRSNCLYFIEDILTLMELWMKFMTRFWEHWLKSMMLISPYGCVFLKIKTSNPLGSAKV